MTPADFLDGLSQHDDAAKARYKAIQEMRFRPEELYPNQPPPVDKDHFKFYQHQCDDQDSEKNEFTFNGALFLRGMDPKKDFDVRCLDGKPGVVIKDPVRMGWGQWFFRGFMHLMQICTGFLIPRVYKKTTMIPKGSGQFGVSSNVNRQIEIYPEGHRYTTISYWSNMQIHSINDPYVSISDRLHLINVPQGHYGLAQKDGRPVFLCPGRHLIQSTNFQLTKKENGPDFRPQTDEVIINKTAHIVRVPEGKIGYVEENGHPRFLMSSQAKKDTTNGTGMGAYVFDHPQCKLGFIESNKREYFQDTRNRVIDCKAVKFVNVEKSHAIQVNDPQGQGKLLIHQEGSHAIMPGQTVAVTKVRDQEKEKIVDINCTQNSFNTPEVQAVSQDGAELSVTANVRFQIVNVPIFITKMGIDDYEKIISDKVQTRLTNLIPKTFYRNAAETKPDNADSSYTITSPEFAKYIFDQLEQDLLDNMGIKLIEISLPKCQPSETSMARISTAKGAILTAQNELVTQKINNEKMLSKAESEGRAQVITATKAAEAAKIKAVGDVEAAQSYAGEPFAARLKEIEVTGKAFEDSQIIVGGNSQFPLLLSHAGRGRTIEQRSLSADARLTQSQH